MNTVLRQLWPFVDKVVSDAVHAKLAETFRTLNLKKFGMASLKLEHFSCGPPPKLGGIKTWCARVRRYAQAPPLRASKRATR